MIYLQINEYNMIVNIITRRIIKFIYYNKNLDISFLNDTVIICIGFTLYFKFTKNLISNNFKDKYKYHALENCKKFGTMLIFKEYMSSNSLNTNKIFFIKLAFTFIAIIIYHLFIEIYIDKYNLKVFKNVNITDIDYMIFESTIFNIVEGDNLKLNIGDLLGRIIYDFYIKKLSHNYYNI